MRISKKDLRRDLLASVELIADAGVIKMIIGALEVLIILDGQGRALFVETRTVETVRREGEK